VTERARKREREGVRERERESERKGERGRERQAESLATSRPRPYNAVLSVAPAPLWAQPRKRGRAETVRVSELYRSRKKNRSAPPLGRRATVSYLRTTAQHRRKRASPTCECAGLSPLDLWPPFVIFLKRGQGCEFRPRPANGHNPHEGRRGAFRRTNRLRGRAQCRSRHCSFLESATETITDSNVGFDDCLVENSLWR
jgi:hypothetical protein